MDIRVVEGDITTMSVDAVVNAANATLLGGAGVDGAIHRAGGPEILEECMALRRTSYPEGLPTGEAVATKAGRLPAKWVIHTVGPVFASDPRPAESLASCYRASLRLAAGLGATSIAFPAISTGVYGYPVVQAAAVAVEAIATAPVVVPDIRLVCFDAATRAAFDRALAVHGRPMR